MTRTEASTVQGKSTEPANAYIPKTTHTPPRLQEPTSQNNHPPQCQGTQANGSIQQRRFRFARHEKLHQARQPHTRARLRLRQSPSPSQVKSRAWYNITHILGKNSQNSSGNFPLEATGRVFPLGARQNFDPRQHFPSGAARWWDEARQNFPPGLHVGGTEHAKIWPNIHPRQHVGGTKNGTNSRLFCDENFHFRCKNPFLAPNSPLPRMLAAPGACRAPPRAPCPCQAKNPPPLYISKQRFPNCHQPEPFFPADINSRLGELDFEFFSDFLHDC